MRAIVGILACALVLAAPISAGETTTTSSRNAQIIKAVFGGYGSQAVAVARCESGLSVWARNGQYLGLFQMGSFARSTYGHANHAWGQARAAYRYFVASGRDWSPWACKPWW